MEPEARKRVVRTELGAFFEGAGRPPHDHRHDVLWEREGLLPPCKRKPTDPYHETPP